MTSAGAILCVGLALAWLGTGLVGIGLGWLRYQRRAACGHIAVGLVLVAFGLALALGFVVPLR